MSNRVSEFIENEPVFVGFVKSALAVAAALSLNVDNELAETLIDAAASFAVVWSFWQSRQSVWPDSKVRPAGDGQAEVK